MVALRSRFSALTSNSFFTDVAKLSVGTLGGRLIMLTVLPLITRIYTPEDFALLAVYFGVVSTISVAACFRLEIAIPLAESDEDAAHLLVLSLLLALSFSVTLMAVSVISPDEIAQLLHNPELAPYLFLVPLGVLLTASYSALQYWATRVRRFASIAHTRLTQSAMGAGTIVGLGWLGLSPLGLLLGYMFSSGAGGLRLGFEAIMRDRAAFGRVSCSGMRKTLKKFHRYPLYSTPESLTNIAGAQIPIIVIAATVGAEAGHLFLAMQVMIIPMALLGASISQVYMSRVAEEMAAERLASYTLSVMRRLIQIGVAPLILLGIVAPILFPVIFGADWARSGLMVTWLVPWMALQIIVSPVSMVILARGWHQLMLLLTMLGLLFRVGAVVMSALLFPDMVVPALVVGSTIYYACVMVWATRAAEFRSKHYRSLSSAFMSWSIGAALLIGLLAIFIL